MGQIGLGPSKDNLLEHVRATFDACLAIMERKNRDYAATDDPFRNLRTSLEFGIAPERAMLVRTRDKLSRINNLLDQPPAVADESLEDAVVDAIGYLVLIKAYREMK